MISALEALGIGWYLAMALPTVFGLQRGRRIASAALLVAATGLLLRPCHFAVFCVTLLTT